jgi:hypothetical protein
METQASPNGPYRLYMYDSDVGLAYAIAPDQNAEFVGMTRNASEVVFTSPAPLTTNDHDTSVDLFEWRLATDEITLLSQGNGQGDTDACSTIWTNKCNVAILKTERRCAGEMEWPFGNPGVCFKSARGLDDTIAEQSGDVYFYSPELLDGDKFGIPNERNLYLVRNGQVQLVATLDKGTVVSRLQISPDGSHAGLLTNSQLTSYENAGFRQMYAYDADEEHLECASCHPSGLPPKSHVLASQGGPFMADDGRVFFATKDSLVPRDQNGVITDVYEYVGGQPQLISSGIGSRDYTGASETLGLFTVPVYTGLESVSADGTDVFFSTFDTLVEEDFNGQFIKFYDARTNGGFPVKPVIAPCAAADECHGVDSSPPTQPVIASGTVLNGGNVVAQRRSKRRKAAAKRRRAQRRRAQRRRAQQRKRRAAIRKTRRGNG